MSEFGWVFFAMFVIAGLIISPVVGFSMWADHTQCSSQASRMGMAYEWGPFEGCMVERSAGRWLPMSALNFNEVTVKP